MKNKKDKLLTGFTIIELIVVVAIIAVLAAIVLVNITSYINKGKNAAIKGNLSSIMTNAIVYFDNNGNYTSFCTSPNATLPNIAANNASNGTAVCNVSSNDYWCDCSPMKVTTEEPANSTFCVDFTGYKKVTQNVGLCATRCPAATGACID